MRPSVIAISDYVAGSILNSGVVVSIVGRNCRAYGVIRALYEKLVRGFALIVGVCGVIRVIASKDALGCYLVLLSIKLHSEGGAVMPLKIHTRNDRAIFQGNVSKVYHIKRYIVGNIRCNILPGNDNLISDIEKLRSKPLSHNIVNVAKIGDIRINITLSHSRHKRVVHFKRIGNSSARFIEHHRFCNLAHFRYPPQM